MTAGAATVIADRDHPRGLAFALVAYLIWGCLPLYFKITDHVPVLEIIAHRILWSVPVAILALALRKRLADLVATIRQPRLLAMAGLSAIFVTLNWGTYVYAIQTEQTIEAAIGYYINPLFSILLGRFVLGERLLPLQWAAIGLAALAVAILTWQTGRIPLVALALTVTWSAYAFCKKALPLGPNQGFALEVILLIPVALLILFWQWTNGIPIHFLSGPRDTMLLLGLGAVTALPLIAYANGAKLLRLTTIGLMQYITPTMVFLTAVLIFHEPFGRAEAIAFPTLWAALALYSVAGLRQYRRR